jgi:hypothetical protein
MSNLNKRVESGEDVGPDAKRFMEDFAPTPENAVTVSYLADAYVKESITSSVENSASLHEGGEPDYGIASNFLLDKISSYGYGNFSKFYMAVGILYSLVNPVND